MRVAVDARHVGRGRGVARYLQSMLAALIAGHPEADWVAVVGPGQESLLPPGIDAATGALPPRLAHAGAAAFGRPRLDRVAGGADVVWIPAPAPVAWSGQVPAVLTIHDISWEQRPSDFTAYERAWHAAARPRRLARLASRTTCVSEATRAAVLAAGWPLGPNGIEVIPEAPAIVARDATPPPRGQYLLFVGALEPRKGIGTLAPALRAARAHGLELPLVVVGEGRLSGLLSGIPGVELSGPAADAELAALYAGATALILPSLLEGFGLPAVEAAACAVPTVASDLPALRESLGDSFLAVPPGDPVALGDALFEIATDGALRRRLGTRAQEAVAPLSWEASAERMFELLREVAGAPAP